MTKKIDVTAIGCAVVDLTKRVDHDVLDRHGIRAGHGATLDAAQFSALMNELETVEGNNVSKGTGGPACNVAMGVARAGGVAALIGRVGDDENGKFVRSRLNAHGVQYDTPSASSATDCIAVLTTEEKDVIERSFAAYLGARDQFGAEDIDKARVDDSKIVYIDTYLWNTPSARRPLVLAMAAAINAGGRVAVSLSDTKLVEKYRDDFLGNILCLADIVVGSDSEFKMLFQVETVEDVIECLKREGIEVASITHNKDGSTVFENGKAERIYINPLPKSEVVDTSGAGDQFAAGFLYGLSQGMPAAEAARIGSRLAEDILRVKGAEPPLEPLKTKPVGRVVTKRGPAV